MWHQYNFRGTSRCALVLGIMVAMTTPALALVIGSTQNQAAATSTAPARPTDLLNGLVSGKRPLNWRNGSDRTATQGDQVIWPPIDQPLNLRGGYKHRREPLAPSEVKSTMPSPTSTPTLSKDDCEAAAAFILASARARDQGVSAERFMTQLRADLLKLGAEPPDTRWFLHSKMEAQLLLSAATRIHREPRAAAWHFTNFVESCDALRASG